MSGELQPQRHLLCEFDRVEGVTIFELQQGATFVQSKLDILKHIKMVGHHRPRAMATALLFVRHRQQHHITRQRHRQSFEHHERQQLHDARPFVIECAATPQIAVAQHAIERRHRPLLRRRRHYIHVMDQHEGLVAAVAAQACIQIGAPRCGFIQSGGDAFACEQGGKKTRRGELIARWIGGVYLHVMTEQAHRFGFNFGG